MAKKIITTLCIASVIGAAVYVFDIFFLVFLGFLVMLADEYQPAK